MLLGASKSLSDMGSPSSEPSREGIGSSLEWHVEFEEDNNWESIQVRGLPCERGCLHERGPMHVRQGLSKDTFHILLKGLICKNCVHDSFEYSNDCAHLGLCYISTLPPETCCRPDHPHQLQHQPSTLATLGCGWDYSTDIALISSKLALSRGKDIHGCQHLDSAQLTTMTRRMRTQTDLHS